MRFLPNKKQLLIDFFISLIIISLIMYFINPSKVFDIIKRMDLTYLVIALGLLFFVYTNMAFRIYFILKKLGTKINYINALKAHYVGMFFSDFTPARTGYFASLFALHKYGIKTHDAMIAIMGPAIYDFILKVVVGTLGLLFISYYFLNSSIIIFLGSFIMFFMVLVMILLLFSRRFLNLLKFFFFLPLVKKIYNMFYNAQKNSKILVKEFPILTFVLITTWAFKSLSWYFVAKALGIRLNLQINEMFFYFLLQPLLTMLEFLPSPTLAGLGISEGAAAFLFSIFGIDKSLGFTFLFIARIKTIFFNLPIVPELIRLFKS